MSKHSDLAVELFHEGYNCAQAVFAAFCDETGMNRETALKLSSSFGGGIGRMREVCGAVSGMMMTAGILYGYSDSKDAGAKQEHYRLVQELAKRFRGENGSIICRELLNLPDGNSSPVPEKRTGEYYKKRPCAELVRCAAEIMDEELERNAQTANKN